MTEKMRLAFPTTLHQQAAETAYQFFQPRDAVDTVLVVNSCARGQAIPESDLDMAVLLNATIPEAEAAQLEDLWRKELAKNPVFTRFQQSGEHAKIHLDLVRGQYIPEVWDDGGGPDGFELGIGNQLVYGAPMREVGPYFRQLQRQWLPYYNDELRRQRLDMVRAACVYDLGHVPFFVGRALYFQAFDRLYKGFQEFLQALFIARRVYPLAYNKWIRMQIEDWLGLPELYRALPPILSVPNIESDALVDRANDLMDLLNRWAAA